MTGNHFNYSFLSCTWRRGLLVFENSWTSNCQLISECYQSCNSYSIENQHGYIVTLDSFINHSGGVLVVGGRCLYAILLYQYIGGVNQAIWLVKTCHVTMVYRWYTTMIYHSQRKCLFKNVSCKISIYWYNIIAIKKPRDGIPRDFEQFNSIYARAYMERMCLKSCGLPSLGCFIA